LPQGAGGHFRSGTRLWRACPKDDLAPRVEAKARAFRSATRRGFSWWNTQGLPCDLYVAAFLFDQRSDGRGALADPQNQADDVPTTVPMSGRRWRAIRRRDGLTASAIDTAEEIHAFQLAAGFSRRCWRRVGFDLRSGESTLGADQAAGGRVFFFPLIHWWPTGQKTRPNAPQRIEWFGPKAMLGATSLSRIGFTPPKSGEAEQRLPRPDLSSPAEFAESGPVYSRRP